MKTSESKLGLSYKINHLVKMEECRNFVHRHILQGMGSVICSSLSILPSLIVHSSC